MLYGMMNEYKKNIDQIEGTQFPSKTYRELVIEPSYNSAKKYFLQYMIQIHIAHLKMLEEQKIVRESDAVKIGKALNNLNVDFYQMAEYDAQFEDLFFRVEHDLIQEAGDIAGNLHIARSRNDMGIAIYRMTLRKKILELMKEMLTLQNRLLLFSEAHVDTIMIGYTHTQQAQPTTLAHYFKAVIDKLGRDFTRVQAAYKTVNCSSMGAAALTTSGFNISRERMSGLLGFDAIIENAWDAVAGADYITETASVVQLSALNLGRTVQDLLIWATKEFDAFTLADPYVQISSIMPQKRNPVSLEHIRSLLSSVVGDTNTVLTMVHNTPFGDIVDTEDDLQPYLWKSIDRLIGIYQLLGSVVLTMNVNKEKLEKRANGSFANVTELADTLVREERITFKQAHKIVGSCVGKLIATGEESLSKLTWQLANEQANIVLNKDLIITEKNFYAALSPQNFVNIRTIFGGPAAATVNVALKQTTVSLAQSKQWLSSKEQSILDAEMQLEKFKKNWSEA